MQKNQNISDYTSTWEQKPDQSFSKPKQVIDNSFIYEMAVIACLIKNKQLHISNINVEIKEIKSKAYFE